MLASLRVCELSENGLDWYVRYLTALASGEQAHFETFLDKDCVYQLNNFLPLYGGATTALAVSRFLHGVEGIAFELLNIYGTDRAFAVELLHHYVRLDGVPITVPAAAFLDRNEAGLLLAARTHIDYTPVFAETLRTQTP